MGYVIRFPLRRMTLGTGRLCGQCIFGCTWTCTCTCTSTSTSTDKRNKNFRENLKQLHTIVVNQVPREDEADSTHLATSPGGKKRETKSKNFENEAGATKNLYFCLESNPEWKTGRNTSLLQSGPRYSVMNRRCVWLNPVTSYWQ